MNLTSSQWIEFDKRYPQAASYINRCSLVNEYRHLTNYELLNLLNDWQKNRLNELRQFEKDTQQDFLNE
jgi:hypothetical protein